MTDAPKYCSIPIPPSIALTAAKSVRNMVEPEMPELPDDLDPKLRHRAIAEFHKTKAIAQFAKRSFALWEELMAEYALKGTKEKTYVAEISGAIVAYAERRAELKVEQNQAMIEVQEFEHNFTGGYVLGTLVALMAKPALLILQILGLWALFGAYIPWLSSKTVPPDDTDVTLWVIVIQAGAAIAATVVAFIFRGILMKIRMMKLAKIKAQKTALANYHYYDGMLTLVIGTALAAERAYRSLTGEDKLTFDQQRAFWDDVVDSNDGRAEFADRAGVAISEVSDIATAVGMTGEEDSLFEVLVDLLSN